jgi:hypothetical protein
MKHDHPIRHSMHDLAAVIAESYGGKPDDYLHDDQLDNLVMLSKSAEFWHDDNHRWPAFGFYVLRNMHGVDFVHVQQALITKAQRTPIDFLIFDLKDGRTALYPHPGHKWAFSDVLGYAR